MKLINWFGLGAFIIGALVTLGHRFGFLHYHIAFVVFVVALIACTLIMLIGLVMLGLLIARKRPIQAELIPIILACAVFPVMSFYAVGMSAFKVPMIHDITTDTNNPPVFKYIQDDGYRVNSLIYPGAEVSALQKVAYPEIKTFITQHAPRRVYQQSIFTGSLLGWEIIVKDSDSLRFEAITKTPLFGFVDDIAVRITPIESGGSAVDMRSMSRVGLSDLGANAKRIRSFFAQLEAVLEEELINLQ
tara:strand:- start:99 stop:836 length:738 start_codon:yes stop_codon:yes gene_type:complete